MELTRFPAIKILLKSRWPQFIMFSLMLGGFLFAILSGPGENLPDDRHERKTRLLELLKDGRAQSLCRIIRDLSQYRSVRALNENDQAMLKQAQGVLLGEWGYSLSLSPAQAALDFHRVLASEPAENVT